MIRDLLHSHQPWRAVIKTSKMTLFYCLHPLNLWEQSDLNYLILNSWGSTWLCYTDLQRKRETIQCPFNPYRRHITVQAKFNNIKASRVPQMLLATASQSQRIASTPVILKSGPIQRAKVTTPFRSVIYTAFIFHISTRNHYWYLKSALRPFSALRLGCATGTHS